MNNLKLLINTIKHLKLKQVHYRIFYLLRNKFLNKEYNFDFKEEVTPLQWISYYTLQDSYLQNNYFIFLNIEHQFDKIDWNYNAYGKLWTYNLNYFDYLNQDNMTKEQGLFLINAFIANKKTIVDGFEPYPISLRGINWIKFLSVHKINDNKINTFLYNDYLRLLDKLEYHILGNHLLENGFSLLFAAYYFKEERFYKVAHHIIEEELEEQVLNDGAHFELSPMYHKILLTKLLDCYNLICLNDRFKDSDFESLLKQKAEVMLGFLENISFKNDGIPLLNDAANNIALENDIVLDYANQLKLKPYNKSLGDSGYRKFLINDFEAVMDVGKVGPKYQPGHAHADTFTFCLNYKNHPVVVDTGTSTYNIGERRDYERSTIAHNTVCYDNKDSSEVWGGFRVANRAKVTILKDTQKELIVEHNGYKRYGITHHREFEILSKKFVIKDYINGIATKNNISSLHFHPETKLDKKDNYLILNDNIKLSWKGFDNVNILDYQYAPEFNKLVDAKKIEGVFKNESEFKFEML